MSPEIEEAVLELASSPPSRSCRRSRELSREKESNLDETYLNEFYKVAFRRKMYGSIDELQADLDGILVEYNESRTLQGKRSQGRTPMLTFLDGMDLVRERQIEPAPQQPSPEPKPSSSANPGDRNFAAASTGELGTNRSRMIAGLGETAALFLWALSIETSRVETTVARQL